MLFFQFLHHQPKQAVASKKTTYIFTILMNTTKEILLNTRMSEIIIN